jgi:hypothetical protein
MVDTADTTGVKIFVPYTKIHSETLLSLNPYEYTTVKMTHWDSYREYFQERWDECETFINVEHDMVFPNGAIEELLNCPELWCGFTQYTIRDLIRYHFGRDLENKLKRGVAPGLALVKFERGFILEHPYMWRVMDAAKAVLNHAMVWNQCDMWAYMNATCHLHYPPILNANPERGDNLRLL